MAAYTNSGFSATICAPVTGRTFRDAIRSCDFVISAQLPLTPGTTAADIQQTVDALQSVVHAVQISDNTTTRPHMSPLAAATLALRAGMDPVVQLTCRDRNRIALQSDLMGAAALGITSLILSRGEKLPASHRQRIKGVFDIGAQRLLATAEAIGANERLVAPPGFFLGSNATVIDPPDHWTADGIDSKASAGSKFVQTQPCLDVGLLRKYMAALVATKALERISVIVQVPLLESLDMLHELRNARRSLLIPRDLLTRLEQADHFGAEAEAICSEALDAVAGVPGVSGANILHRGDSAAVVRVVTAIHRVAT
jgi:methylenetetrahydrofolate reductase (NADPH)